MVTTILMVFAFVLLLLEGVLSPRLYPNLHLGWVGMALWALAIILGGVGLR
jgi:hypothetical protein